MKTALILTGLLAYPAGWAISLVLGISRANSPFSAPLINHLPAYLMATAFGFIPIAINLLIMFIFSKKVDSTATSGKTVKRLKLSIYITAVFTIIGSITEMVIPLTSRDGQSGLGYIFLPIALSLAVITIFLLNYFILSPTLMLFT